VTKVLVIEPSGQRWGSERALIDLMLSAPGLEFAVCCPPNAHLIAEMERREIRYLPWIEEGLHGKSRWRRLGAALGILKACFVFRPDVIHLNQSGSYRIARPAARLMGLKIVAHVRIFEDAAYLASCAPDPATLSGIVAISGSIEAEIRRFDALSAIPVHRIYDAYATSQEATAEGGSQQRSARVACVGRIVPTKGQEVLVAAAELIGAEFLIIGDGETAHVGALKASSPFNVVWTGFVGDIVPLLRTCSVLACPSHREPLGRVIFEAWDAGAIPVVFEGAGGAPEIVIAADGGLTYEEQTPESLAAALSAALSLAPSDRARLVANGRAWMRSNVAPGPYGEAIARVLRTAAQP
jgi:glycosyltransferase involved in cell wall biosynthesis